MGRRRRGSSLSFRVISTFLLVFHVGRQRHLSSSPLWSSFRQPRLSLASLMPFSETETYTAQRRRLSESSSNTPPPHPHERQQQQQRVLYICTSMKEIDDGRRDTVLGYDRFSKTIVPLLVESTASMIETGYYHVDLYFISHYPFTDARRTELRTALPASVGLQIWDDATPLSYASELNSRTKIQEITRGLARQHRYVIKDKFWYYDMFVNFEDDMLIKGTHVQHYSNLTNELYRLRQQAPADLEQPTNSTTTRMTQNQALQVFYGPMTSAQLERTMPGFIRVEAAIRGFTPHQENLYAQIPMDYDWNATRTNLHLDPSICCHVTNHTANEQVPLAPAITEIYFWETSIDALGVRKLPDHAAWDWVLLQAGNRGYHSQLNAVIGDYWSGQDHGYFGKEQRPDRVKGRYLNNQGGWMGTRRQVWELQHRCADGFLPPYDMPDDGLDKNTVEFWSGGIQLVASGSCNMQRIVALDPKSFSKHLLYHTSNNKQRASNVRHRYSSRTIDEFWGQLNTVRKNAEGRMKELKLT